MSFMYAKEREKRPEVPGRIEDKNQKLVGDDSGWPPPLALLALLPIQFQREKEVPA